MLSIPSRATARWLIALCLLLVALYQVRAQHLDDRLYFWIKTHWYAEQWQDNAVWLPDYRADLQAKAIPGIDNNLSGLSYDPDRDVLWAVTNGPNELLVLSREGTVEARYALAGFHDVEAVSYLGGNQLAIAEERRQSLVVVPVPTGADGQLLGEKTLARDDYSGLTLAFGEGDNKGFEGLAYDIKGDRLFVAKERDPRQLLEISGLRQSLEGSLSLQVRDLTAGIKNKVFVTDLSSVVFDQASGHLILLSDESKLLIEMTDEGQVVSFRSLAAGFSGLDKGIPQAEGVTLDNHGNLYLISEPNLFYRFTRNK